MWKSIKQRGILFSILLLPFLLYFALLIISKDKNRITTLPVVDPNPGLRLTGPGFSESDFRNKVSVLVFNGNADAENRRIMAGLYDKVYHPYRRVKSFQMVSFVTSDSAKERLQKDLVTLHGEPPDNWPVYVKPCVQLSADLKRLPPPLAMNPGCGSHFVLLLDEDLALRGRVKDEKYGSIQAYDASNVSMLSSELKDDIHILLAEYRLKLKKNDKYNKYKLKEP